MRNGTTLLPAVAPHPGYSGPWLSGNWVVRTVQAGGVTGADVALDSSGLALVVDDLQDRLRCAREVGAGTGNSERC